MALSTLDQTSSTTLPSAGSIQTVAGVVPPAPALVLSGPRSSSSPDLRAYFAAVHQGYLDANAAISALMSKRCWPVQSSGPWNQARNDWAAIYSKGVTASSLPAARQAASKLLDWRQVIWRNCRNPYKVRLAWTVGGNTLTYEPSADDVLWLKRMVQAEIKPGAPASTRSIEAKRVVQTMLNWFGFAKSIGRYKGYSLVDAIRSYSEPMKPTAPRAEQKAAQVRNKFMPEVEEAVRAALTLGPVDIPTGTVHWGAPGFNENNPAFVMTYPGPGSSNYDVNRYYAQKNSLTFPGYRPV